MTRLFETVNGKELKEMIERGGPKHDYIANNVSIIYHDDIIDYKSWYYVERDFMDFYLKDVFKRNIPLCVPETNKGWAMLTRFSIDNNCPEMYLCAAMKKFIDMSAVSDPDAKNVFMNMKDDFVQMRDAFGDDGLKKACKDIVVEVAKQAASSNKDESDKIIKLLENLTGTKITLPEHASGVDEDPAGFEHPEDDQETVANAGVIYPLIFDTLDLAKNMVEYTAENVVVNNEQWASRYPQLNPLLDAINGQFMVIFIKTSGDGPRLSYMNLHDMSGNYLTRLALDTGELYGLGVSLMVPILSKPLMDWPVFPFRNSIDTVLDVIFGRKPVSGLVNELGSEVATVCRKIDMSSLPTSFDPAKGYTKLIQALSEALAGKVEQLGDYRYRFAEFKSIGNFKLTTEGANGYLEMDNPPTILTRDHITVSYNGKGKVKYVVDVSDSGKTA